MKSIEVVGAFIGGALIGAAVALLVAPKSGEETRAAIRNYVDDEFEKYRCKCRHAKDDIEIDVDELRRDIAK